MNFIFLESFYGGSHRDFADGLIDQSAHHIDLITLPSRFWKWRMRGAALYFARKIDRLEAYDGLIITDLMSLADFKALKGAQCPPALVYFHENQLSYPLAPGEQMDYQFGFTDITTALAADRLLFNSRFHLSSFLSKLRTFIGMMPEFRPKWVTPVIESKARVLHPGCHFPKTVDGIPAPFATEGPPLIIWNHRWEFDKDPDTFFDVLEKIDRRGYQFRVALLGENFQTLPRTFIAARQRFQNQIVHYGYEPSKTAYIDWLKKGDIVISTAQQENFGISIVEAIHYGCLPLLPNRLSYPEILPERYHADFLYQDQSDLIQKLIGLLTGIHRHAKTRLALAAAMDRFAWDQMIAEYDRELDQLACLKRG